MNEIAALSAPMFDNFIARAQLHPNWLNQTEKEALLRIIEQLQCIAICGSDECRELWLTAERGTIEDFGDYDDYLENEIVGDREEFEQMWKEYYPNLVKWYLLSITRYNEETFLFIDNKLTLHIEKEKSTHSESFNLQLITWIDQAVSKSLDWLKKDADGYNEYIRQHLPYTKRTGRILRQDYWSIDSEEKEWMLKGLTSADIDILKTIVEFSEGDNQIIPLDKMTAGFFFGCCKMGYDANIYLYSADMTPAELYRKFADGRDYGLTKLNPDSPQAFEDWFDKREWQIGHPWEVCRGGNSTHISLYVGKQQNGWRLSLAGKSRGRVAETVRFAIALYNNSIPFKLWNAKEILAMVSGTDYIGIVPEGVTPVYCHSYFPEKDHIIDFMNLPTENEEKIANAASWYAIGEIK